MKFLVDAQLPRRLGATRKPTRRAMHTLDLPNGNNSTDAEINVIAEPSSVLSSPRTRTSSTPSSLCAPAAKAAPPFRPAISEIRNWKP